MSGNLTLIIGPQTKGAFALNAYARAHGVALQKQGIKACPLRAASPLLWRCTNPNRPLEERKAEFAAEMITDPTTLCALNFLGPPDAVLKTGTLFPDPAETLAPLGEVAGAITVVLLVDSLPNLFLAPNAPRLEARVQATGWEKLYDLTWIDTAKAITTALRKAELLVLTPRGMAHGSEALLRRIFHCEGDLPGDSLWLLRHAMTDTGHAVLDRMRESKVPDWAMQQELYASFATRPDVEEIQTRLGIEKITAELLDQRFEEDLAAIAMLPRTEVI